MTDGGQQWRWLSADGVTHGVSERELMRALGDRSVPADALVWRTGWGQWLPACRVAELAVAVGPQQAQPPIPQRLDPDLTEPPPPPRPQLVPPAFGGVPVEVPPDDVISLEPDALISEFDLEDLSPPTPAPDEPAAPPPAAGAPPARAAPAERSASAPTASVVEPMGAPPPALLYGSAVLAGLLAVGSLAVILMLLPGACAPGPGSPPSATSVGEAATSPLPSPGSCALITRPRRIASAIERSVPPQVAPVPGSGQVAVGFAETATLAVGATVDLPSLESHQAFTQPGSRSLQAVVPTTRSGKLGFVADRADPARTPLRTVDATSPFRIGRDPSGIVRVVGEALPHAIWPGAGDQAITLPRVATLPNLGHVVTFRRGGMSGHVLVGFLNPDGSGRGALEPIATTDLLLGTPSVAANDHGILVTFAARSTAAQPWSVHLSRAEALRPPVEATRFSLPPGGSGGEAIAPSAAGLPGARWLLQWTEGAAGGRQVRVQVLDADLQPNGPAVGVSPPGINAGQGVPVVVGPYAVSVYLVVTGERRELWATTLRCSEAEG